MIYSLFIRNWTMINIYYYCYWSKGNFCDSRRNCCWIELGMEMDAYFKQKYDDTYIIIIYIFKIKIWIVRKNVRQDWWMLFWTLFWIRQNICEQFKVLLYANIDNECVWTPGQWLQLRRHFKVWWWSAFLD